VDSPSILKFEVIKNEIQENPQDLPENPPKNPPEDSEANAHIGQQVDPKGT